MVQARLHDTDRLVEAPVAIGHTLIDSGAAIDERQLADVDGPALLKLYAALPPKHPSRATVRARTIETWMPLAYSLANRFHGRGEAPDDLAQTAAVGLIKAVDRFDPTRGVEFAAYAVPTIVGEIKRYFRDHTWDVRVPRRVQELRLGIADAVRELSHTLHREPTLADIATHLGVTKQDVRDGMEGAGAYKARSLQAPARAGDDAGELGDLLGGDDDALEVAELRVLLAPALAQLDPRERRIVAYRFFANLTQSEIAERIGVSQMHISRLLARALATLKAHLGEDFEFAGRTA